MSTYLGPLDQIFVFTALVELLHIQNSVAVEVTRVEELSQVLLIEPLAAPAQGLGGLGFKC